MFKRGYKAREEAGLARSNQRESEEVRLARAAYLETSIAALTNTAVDEELAAAAVPGATHDPAEFDDKPSDAGITKLANVLVSEDAEDAEAEEVEGEPARKTRAKK